jgi:hypothetical protein
MNLIHACISESLPVLLKPLLEKDKLGTLSYLFLATNRYVLAKWLSALLNNINYFNFKANKNPKSLYIFYILFHMIYLVLYQICL